MLRQILSLFLILLTSNQVVSQKWMTNLDIAQKLALDQNKMVLMVWEGTTKYPYPVLVQDSKGRTLFVEDLFTDENLSPLIWDYFVPVIVSENRYPFMIEKLEDKYGSRYLEKFEDDSIKIMDVNGIIVNSSMYSYNYTNVTKLINDYAFDTRFLEQELKGYKERKDFYSVFYLASRYLDFSMYVKDQIRSDIISVFNIYLDEAKRLVKDENTNKRAILMQRVKLLEIKKYLILKRPKKVIRLLNRMDADTIKNNNRQLVALLYFTAYSITKDRESVAKWRPEVSDVNLKKAQLLVNLNN